MKNQPPLRLMIPLFLLTLSGYLITLNSALFRNDSPETITGCISLGVTHPPGYPLFNMLGKCFYFFKVGNPAFTYNFMAALLAAISVGLLFMNLWVLLSSVSGTAIKKNDFFNPVTLSAFIGALSFAFSDGYWGNAIAAKGGIYVFQMVLELTFFLFFQTITLKEKPTHLYFLPFIFSLGLANQWPSQLLLVPACLFILALRLQNPNRPDLLKTFKTVIFSISIVCVSLSLYLYLPLRSHLYPALNFYAPFTWNRFIHTVLRINYTQKEMMTAYPVTFLRELSEKSLYLSQHLSNEFHFTSYFFVLLGVWSLVKINKKITVFCSIFLLTTIMANLIYLQVSPIEFWHLDDHLLSSNWLLGLFLGIGIFTTFNVLMTYPFPFRKIFRSVLVVLVFSLAPFTFLKNFDTNHQTHKFLYYGYGITALQSLPQNALYFAESDYDYFSVLYLKTVLNKRPDTHLFLTLFLTQPYERNLLSKTDPALHLPAQSQHSVLFDLVENNSSNPLYSTFSSVSFLNLYLQNFGTMKLMPSGILTHIIQTHNPLPPPSLYQPLQAFQEDYLQPEIDHPSPTQGILREACASPYLNAAKYERIRNQWNHWDWYYSIAISLISDPSWLAQAWLDRAQGDDFCGNKTMAARSYQIAGYDYFRLGLMNKARMALQKAQTLNSVRTHP